MGRHSTGIWKAKECKRIELSNLIKRGYLKKGQKKLGSLTWANENGQETGKIRIYCVWTTEEKYIRLIYTLNGQSGGQSDDYDYKIYLTTIPSNLGIGEVLYFICPDSGKRCRILYAAYGYNKWKSREAYQNRIYYSCQAASKYDYANSRFWELERTIKRLSEQRFRWTYGGQYTQKALRLLKMEEEQRKWNRIRWSEESMSLSMRKDFATGLYDDFRVED